MPSAFTSPWQRLGLSIGHATDEVGATGCTVIRGISLPFRCAAALIGRVLTAYTQFVEQTHRDKFAELWARFDVLRGQPVTVTQGLRTISGIATGIDDEGSLVVKLNANQTERFRAGEVTLSKTSA